MSHTAEELQQAFHYLYPAEIPALKQLARSLPSNPTVINIGAGAGTSGLAFMESRGDITLCTVDIQDESSPLGCLEGERVALWAAGYVLGWGWHQTHADSKVAGLGWRGGPVDMVFIDGDHSYEGCAGDIEAWLPHIKPGGIMAVHDYAKEAIPPTPDGPHPLTWDGVTDAVNKLLVGRYEQVLRVDSLIAFRVGG